MELHHQTGYRPPHTGMSETTIQPIDSTQQALVKSATLGFIHRATEHFQQAFAPLPVAFDLRGRSAGQFQVQGNRLRRHYRIRYNPWVFAVDLTHHLNDTVPHEVAHYITYLRHPQAPPHGREWKALMRLFGATPRARSSYSLDGIALRQQRRHPYQCECQAYSHSISTTIHNRIQRGQPYLCRRCRKPLRPVSSLD